ncbi:MAG: prolipoprotein diacylglyceryl transferase [candidate division Zixibacteria bacterium]|nr:prolipoprotein diacylglyceryl transferase [candidate division Zixibacteria bacterium]
MCPELFHIGSLPIRGYGIMLALSFFVGVLYIRYVCRKYERPFEQYLAIAYIMIFGGVIGARLFYILFHLSEFSNDWSSAFNPFSSENFGIAGLNLYGGVLVAIAGSMAYTRWKRLSVLDTFDYFSPTLGLGLGLTRIGCFLNGCCFGTPTDLPWGMSFPAGSLPYFAYHDAALHPAQLYSSLYGLGLFLVLHYMMKRRAFVGQLVAILFMVEAIFRFAIEYVRYYEDAMHFSFDGLEPTYNQLISVVMFLAGLGIYIWQNKHGRLTSNP